MKKIEKQTKNKKIQVDSKNQNVKDWVTAVSPFYKIDNLLNKIVKEATLKNGNIKEVKKDFTRIEVKRKIKTPNTPIIKKNKVSKMFKFVQANKIRDPLKLLVFIKWLAITPKERELKTQRELAIKIGVNVDTLTDWKKLTGFWDEVAIHRNQFFRKYTSSIYYGLVKKAKTGDPRAVELFSTLFEDYKKKVAFKEMKAPKEITPKAKEEINHALKHIGLASIIKHNNETDNND